MLLGATRELLLLLSLLLLLRLLLGLLMLLKSVLLNGLFVAVIYKDGCLLVFSYFGGMNASSVSVQVRFLRERLRTEVAFVRLVTSVDAIVSV